MAGERVSRRRFLGLAGAAGGVAAGASVGLLAQTDHSDRGHDAQATVAFHGAHQAGIITLAQDRLHFAAFDVVDDVPRGELADLMAAWTAAAARMTAGRPVGRGDDPLAPPPDTGEAEGLPAARLSSSLVGTPAFRKAIAVNKTSSGLSST